jgi:hypothetical protein
MTQNCLLAPCFRQPFLVTLYKDGLKMAVTEKIPDSVIFLGNRSIREGYTSVG